MDEIFSTYKRPIILEVWKKSTKRQNYKLVIFQLFQNVLSIQLKKKNTFWDRYCKNRIFLHYSLVYQFLQFLKAIKIQEIFATTKEKKIPLKIPDIKCFVLKPGYKKSIKHLTHYWPSTFHHICCYPNITGFVKIYIFFFTVTH